MQRPVFKIAEEILLVWKNPYFGAKPYIQAMCYVARPEDPYGAETGRDLIIGFLANASTFRGENAKRIKAELKKLIA